VLACEAAIVAATDVLSKAAAKLNIRSELFFGTASRLVYYRCGRTPKEIIMRKLVLALATLAALGFTAAPVLADPIVVVHHHHHHHHVIIIKHHHHH
jgi:hypothetical protein